MSEAGIAFALGQFSKGRCTLYSNEDAVKIVSMHSSKNLEFAMVVLVPGLSDIPKKGEDEADRRVLLYVAMTRAIDRLAMT
ncbi:3'-5' exonuclease [Pseudomonas protegens]|uniref:3'-5' exonuclease n=1 Tax=Pseudomonas protegens TaxID=380021 RepID=UPI001FF07EEF|nr:3'-5' exonuclease [Pseudomonas protegens]